MIVKNGKTITFSEGIPMDSGLKKGVYVVRYNEIRDLYYLEETGNFSIPKKIYGDDLSEITRWIKRYNSIERNLGILLTGIKGSGKTVTAKKLCIESGLPVLIIPEAYSGPSFISFMTNPELGDCVVFVDEFEKIYKKCEYEETVDVDILTLLDGPYCTHHMYIFTTNDESISNFLINRPSRIFYRREYDCLSKSVIRDIGNDMLKNKEYVDELVLISSKVKMSYDLITSLINESNMFDESPIESINHMCVNYDEFEVVSVEQRNKNGKVYTDCIESRYFNFSSSDFFSIKFFISDEEDDYRYVKLDAKKLKFVSENCYSYELKYNEIEATIVITLSPFSFSKFVF